MAGQLDRRDFLRAGAVTLGAAGLTGAALLGAEPSAAATLHRPAIPGRDGAGRSLAYLGVYDPKYPNNHSGVSQPELDLEKLIGRRFAINHLFRSKFDSHWTTLGERMPADLRAGRIPLLSWGCRKTHDDPNNKEHSDSYNTITALHDIATGKRDADIDLQARRLRDLKKPVFLRFSWEMDLHVKGEHGEATYRAAWRHVWTRFQRMKADNVAFVWCPSWRAFAEGTARNFYPGDAYVHWVGADGYSRPSPRTHSFVNLFTDAHGFAHDHRRPFMVCETGVHALDADRAHAGTSTTQSRWLDEVGHALNVGHFASLKALVYFHLDGPNGDHPKKGLPNHWRVTVPKGGPAAKSFHTLARNPRLRALA